MSTETIIKKKKRTNALKLNPTTPSGLLKVISQVGIKS